jgi:hypothetical protein
LKRLRSFHRFIAGFHRLPGSLYHFYDPVRNDAAFDAHHGNFVILPSGDLRPIDLMLSRPDGPLCALLRERLGLSAKESAVGEKPAMSRREAPDNVIDVTRAFREEEDYEEDVPVPQKPGDIVDAREAFRRPESLELVETDRGWEIKDHPEAGTFETEEAALNAAQEHPDIDFSTGSIASESGKKHTDWRETSDPHNQAAVAELQEALAKEDPQAVVPALIGMDHANSARRSAQVRKAEALPTAFGKRTTWFRAKGDAPGGARLISRPETATAVFRAAGGRRT